MMKQKLLFKIVSTFITAFLFIFFAAYLFINHNPASDYLMYAGLLNSAIATILLILYITKNSNN
jgi:hypothetical protein